MYNYEMEKKISTYTADAEEVKLRKMQEIRIADAKANVEAFKTYLRILNNLGNHGYKRKDICQTGTFFVGFFLETLGYTEEKSEWMESMLNRMLHIEECTMDKANGGYVLIRNDILDIFLS